MRAGARRKIARLKARHPERVGRGMLYPKWSHGGLTVMAALEKIGPSHLAADASGVGRPCRDLLKPARTEREL